jgi:predicted AlkP superfamily pyrophosphatase or phosphodiesterase
MIPRLAAALAIVVPVLVHAADAPRPARLAVVISIDQFRADYLMRFRPYFVEGGLNRFWRDGLVFTDAHYRHGITKTAPGHGVMLSGVHANLHGVIANDWKLRVWPALEDVNAVEDRDSPLVGLPPRAWRSPGGVLEAKSGRSPRHFNAVTVGDQLKLRHGARSRVFGVADKDRAAILMAGRLADAAYWTEEGRVVTSTFYRPALPEYFAALNAEGRADRLFGKEWTRLLDAAVYDAVQGPDDAPGESDALGLARTFPKRLDGGAQHISSAFYEAFDHTPWNNELVGAMAKEVIAREGLGADDAAPDLLAIGFSQPDKIGHAYGPDSHEVMDSILRLDRLIAELFAFIDEKVGLGNCIVVLTADHGVAPLPEKILALNRGIEAGRVRGADVDRHVFAALSQQFGALAENERWAVRDGSGYHLNLALLEQKQITAWDAEVAVRDALLAYPAIARAYTRSELTFPAPLDEIGEATRLSYYPPRSPDVMYVLKPYFMEKATAGTTHALPYAYDTHVPIAFFGAGIARGVRTERIGVDDIAPTMANLLQVPRPPQALGRVLF